MYSVMKHDTVDKIFPQGTLIFAINKNKGTVLLQTQQWVTMISKVNKYCSSLDSSIFDR
jgi:hypothetical protein